MHQPPSDPKSVSDAIAVALEALPGSIDSNLIDMKNVVVRTHVIEFVKEFARARGVIFDDKDIADEIEERLRELKRIAIARTKTPR